jgi:UDP-N-acetylmuramate dehydrogenase
LDLTKIREICEHYDAEFLHNTPIAPYTSFKIGGKCNIIKITATKVLQKVMKHCCENNIPYYVLGKGSNVLISDAGLTGVVLLIAGGKIDVDGEVLKCHAGAKLSDICKAAVMHNLSGMEFAYGIPGTAGGALCMNAGAYGGEMSDVIESCTYIDCSGDFEPQTISAKDMNLSYRHSVFAEQEQPRRAGSARPEGCLTTAEQSGVITKIRLKLKYGERAVIKARMDEITEARKEKQPLDYPSAGSIFKRPDSIEHPYAAKLIEDCGLKGHTIGGAQVSEKHSGFIINTGSATFADVTALISHIREVVREKTGVTLEPEVKIWE